MPNIPEAPFSLSTYITGIIDKKLKALTLSITGGNSFLKNAVTIVQSDLQVTQTDLQGAQAVLQSFDAVYLGVNTTDPAVGANNTPLVVGSFYLRSTDGEFRYVSAIANNVPTWQSATVPAQNIMPGIFTVTGTGQNAGLRPSNNNSTLDIRVIQKDNGDFSITNDTSGTELLSISSSGAGGLLDGKTIWTSGNMGSGSGLDADTLDGSHWTSGQTVSFGPTTVVSPSSGIGGLTVVADPIDSHSSIQFTNATNNVTYGYLVATNSSYNFWSDTGLDTIYLSNGTGTNTYKVWTAGNDGSGSGLDADTLDGYHWTSGQTVSFGQATVQTPAGGGGGLTVVADTTDTNATIVFQNAANNAGIGALYAQSNETLNWSGTGGIYNNGSKVWTSGNDGSGSGLDADMLDGQHGSYYFSPAHMGSGSGLDADTLDGSHWTSGQTVSFGQASLITPSIGAALTITAGGTATNAIIQFNTVGNTAIIGVLYAETNGILAWSGVGDIYANNNKVWSSGNDGSGSGLDADMLDGQHGSYYFSPAHMGSASGLDADMLDGQHGSYYFSPAHMGSGSGLDADTLDGSHWTSGQTVSFGPTTVVSPSSGIGGLTVVADPIDSHSSIQFTNATNNVTYGYLVATNSGYNFWSNTGLDTIYLTNGTGTNTYKVWTAGNDGSGSGLDADTLDGYHWTSGQTVSFGPATVISPAGGGIGLTIIADPIYEKSAIQFNNSANTAAYGVLYAAPGGILSWSGTGGIYANNNKVWTSGNMGSGSGLDADTLDGSHWTSGQNVSFGQATIVSKGGVGLAIVADPIYEKSGIQFTNAANSVTYGYLTVYNNGYNLWSNTGFDTIYISNGTGTNTYKVWTAGNDGSGSGLDADTLDGHHATDFALLSQFTTQFSQNGYIKIPGTPTNTIIQFGYATTGGTFSFPIQFPSTCVAIYASNSNGQGNVVDNAFAYIVSNTQFYANTKSSNGGYSNYPLYWWAIGY